MNLVKGGITVDLLSLSSMACACGCEGPEGVRESVRDTGISNPGICNCVCWWVDSSPAHNGAFDQIHP